MSYRAPLSEISFLLDHILNAAKLAETELFAEATGDTRDAILTEAAKMAEATLAPLNREGDLHPAKLENGVVRTSPALVTGFAPSPMAAGSAFPLPKTMAAWACRSHSGQR